jgi:hypothetical protein
MEDAVERKINETDRASSASGTLSSLDSIGPTIRPSTEGTDLVNVAGAQRRSQSTSMSQMNDAVEAVFLIDDDDVGKLFRVLYNHLALGQFELARASMRQLMTRLKLKLSVSLETLLKSLLHEGIPKQWYGC